MRLFLVVVICVGCVKAKPYPFHLLSLDARKADCPVMLSAVPTSQPGRALRAVRSGTRTYVATHTYTYRKSTSTFETRRRDEGDGLPAWEKVWQVWPQRRPRERWLQVERAELRGRSAGGSDRAEDRFLELEVTVHE